jgi:SulP family sulfate permease
VLLGVMISMLSFVVTFSRSSVVKHRFTGMARHSNVDRAPRELGLLRARGEQVQGAVFQGYLFFGTATAVLDQLRAVPGNARVLLLDFWFVRGIDASSVMVMRKLQRLCTEAKTEVVFTGLSPALQEKMRACGLDVARGPVRHFQDLDRGLEWAEQMILNEALDHVTLEQVVGGLTPEEAATAAAVFQEQTVAAGETFIRKGDPADTLYVVLQGRVSIELVLNGSDYRKRLRTYGPGTIIGEMGFYSGVARSANISADSETRLLFINREDFAHLEKEHPALAAKLHRLVVNTLASRLRVANDALSDLL